MISGSKNQTNGAEGVAIVGNYQGKTYNPRWRRTPIGELSTFLYVDFEWQRRRYNQSTGTSDVRTAHGVAKQKIAGAMNGHWQQLEVTKLRQAGATIGEVPIATQHCLAARPLLRGAILKKHSSSRRGLLRRMSVSKRFALRW